jgi:hypothetical protein
MVTGAAAQQRAMYNRNNLDGPQFKIENDTRITPLGKLLRATNIDELPQLFNVLRGEMSLVGPRPSPFRENQICVPWRQARLAVRPGITGLWQMCRHNRALGDFHQWIWYDLLYVRHLSARCDAAILLATLLTLGGRRSVSIAWFLPRSAREGGERSSRLPRRVPILEPPSSAGGLRLVATDQVETAGTDQTRDEFIARLNDIALRALPRMFIPDQRVFVHSLRRRGGLLVPTGQSLRYTAIVLIGLREMPSEDVQSVLRGEDPGEVLDYLLAALPRLTNLGDVAAIYWAACHWEHRRRDLARQRMAALLDFNCAHKTVDIAWCLSACCTEPTYSARSGALRYKLADLLMAAFQGKGNLFPYRIGPRLGLRGHVACFADQVYPIMALSLYHSTTRSPAALEIAARTAESICRQMGPGGQWWWHYDARNGEVIEKYPVYAVHQDAMAPMALHCLEEAGGPSHRFELERGLDWLRSAAELRGGSLVDDAAGVIWRKVGRREPRKLVRTMQSVASGAHAGWRIPGVDFALPPRSIDFECRPYHLGWFFVAFGRRMARGTPGERAKIA